MFDLVSRRPTNYAPPADSGSTSPSHALIGTTRTLAYGYDNVSNRTWQKRDGGNGDVFGYDKNDQSISILLNIANPDTTSPGSQTINYDPNGNRTIFSPYGSTDTYSTNNLNQYTARNSNNASYDPNGNMTTGVDGSTYTYDSQNRLLTAAKNGTTDTFTYDSLNRQVSRKIGTATPLYNVYDGWQLIGEYNPNATSPLTAYLTGATDLVKGMTATSSFYYYQDASGSTSHLADNTGHLTEWYRYDLHGTPIFYNSSNTQLSTSSYGIRHLFTGQQWYSEIGLYDLRNRYYSPDIGRFLQADPTRFNGDASNIYRYCRNNPVGGADPTGLYDAVVPIGGGPDAYAAYNYAPSTVWGPIAGTGVVVVLGTPFVLFTVPTAVVVDGYIIYQTVEILNHGAMPPDEPSSGPQEPPPPTENVPTSVGSINPVGSYDAYGQDMPVLPGEVTIAGGGTVVGFDEDGHPIYQVLGYMPSLGPSATPVGSLYGGFGSPSTIQLTGAQPGAPGVNFIPVFAGGPPTGWIDWPGLPQVQHQ